MIYKVSISSYVETAPQICKCLIAYMLVDGTGTGGLSPDSDMRGISTKLGTESQSHNNTEALKAYLGDVFLHPLHAGLLID
jgi:hypothetical protein